jgi:small subunit ribosomal protein S7
MEWILAAADKKQSRGSGDGQFAQRVAEELVAVVEGRSGVWDRRAGLHKQGVAARANLFFKPMKKRRMLFI